MFAVALELLYKTSFTKYIVTDKENSVQQRHPSASQCQPRIRISMCNKLHTQRITTYDVIVQNSNSTEGACKITCSFMGAMAF